MATIYLGRLDPWTAYAWIAAVSIAVIAVIARSIASRGTAEKGMKRFSSISLLTLALIVPVASLIGALVCFTILHAHPLSQYNDEATRGVHRLWGALWPFFVGGIPLTALLQIRPILSAARARTVSGVATCLLVLATSTVSWLAVWQNFPST